MEFNIPVLESQGKLKFCLIDYLLQMTMQGQCKVEWSIIKQRKRPTF